MEQQVQLKVQKDSTEVRANTNRSPAAKKALFTRQNSIVQQPMEVQPMEQQVQLKVQKDSTEVRANTNRSPAAKKALFTRQNSIVQPMQPVEERHKGVIKVTPRKSVEVTSSRASHVRPLQLKGMKDSEEVRANTNRSPVKQQVSRHVQFERFCQLVAKLKKKKKAAPKGKTCKTPMRHESLIRLGPKKPKKDWRHIVECRQSHVVAAVPVLALRSVLHEAPMMKALMTSGEVSRAPWMHFSSKSIQGAS